VDAAAGTEQASVGRRFVLGHVTREERRCCEFEYENNSAVARNGHIKHSSIGTIADDRIAK